MTSQQKIIAQGAEATITLNENIITKNRLQKSYRIPELDNRIRKRRTKKEIKLLTKASSIINCPLPLGGRTISRENSKNKIASEVASKGGKTIHMPFISGKKLSQHLNEFPLTKQKQILKQIGQDVSKLHNAEIIHGDLTTSNMILVEPRVKKISKIIKSPAKKSDEVDFEATNSRAKGEPIIYFIDFGLGFISRKIEDKAVDIHLLRQALEAKHFEHWEILFKEFIKGYKNKEVISRLKIVEKRGRYKG